MGVKITASKLSFNIQVVPSARLPAQGVTNPQRYFGETMPQGALSATLRYRDSRVQERFVNVLTKSCHSASSFLPFRLYLLLTFYLSHDIPHHSFLSLVLSFFLS
jgi:hypothetical protein